MRWLSGGYTATHPVIQTFWEVVEGFTEEEKRKLLKFVTSCSRPPLLGFKVRADWSCHVTDNLYFYRNVKPPNSSLLMERTRL